MGGNLLPTEIRELTKRIEVAKKTVIVSGYNHFGQREIENYEEVSKILGISGIFANVFIRDAIANKEVTIKNCINFFKR